MTQESSATRPPYTVFTIVDTGGERSKWLECGIGFMNRDGSINLLLNALPVNGRLQVRSTNGKGERETES
jgi:hypothetical protein